MKLRLLLGHATTKGPVFIARSEDGRFHVMWRHESLGSYISAAHAADDAGGGHVFTPSDGTDLGELAISRDLGDWLPAADFDQ